MSEIASDERSETFVTTQTWIAFIAGVSSRTVFAHLQTFTELGLVHIVTPTMRAPSTYTLIPFRNQCETFRNAGIIAPVRTSEESPKNKEEFQKNLSAAPAEPGRDRTQDTLFEALCLSMRYDSTRLTKSERAGIDRALREIRQAEPNLRPEELRYRANNYGTHFPRAALTPRAIATHWNLCHQPKAAHHGGAVPWQRQSGGAIGPPATEGGF
ncbi:MAG: hypothetical protein IT582_01685 [Opitutaceae bacterium]|nr:hypothetical protein [Opitutaceae bacterium]